MGVLESAGSKRLRTHISETITVNGTNGRSDRAHYLKYAFGSVCKVESFNLGLMRSNEIGGGLTMLFYRAAVNGFCGKDTVPPKSFAAMIYKRENGPPKLINFMEGPVRN